MTYYVSTDGLDGIGHSGLIGDPWHSLSYACSRVSTPGDIIYIYNGNYTEGSRCTLQAGISIQGQSRAGVVITATWVGSADDPLIRLHTNNGWLSPTATQTLSQFTLNGNGYASYGAIRINYRSNVKIDYVRVYDFHYYGIMFYGNGGTWTVPSVFESGYNQPSYWCVGNEITNCIISNNALGDSYSNVCFGQQDGFLMAYNAITQPVKLTGGNCGGVKFFDEGYNKNTSFHDNEVSVFINTNNLYNFAMEMWFEMGGCEYYNNDIEGTFDLDCTHKGDSTYGAWLHDNYMGQPTHGQSHSNASSTLVGIDIEATCRDIIIENNTIHHCSTGIYFSHIWPNDEHDDNNVFENIRISGNKIINLGVLAGGAADWEPVYGIMCGRGEASAGTAEMNNIEIYNNVIECSTAVTSQSGFIAGIWLPQDNMVADGFYIKNNIIKGFVGGGYYSAAIFGNNTYGGSLSISNLEIDYNDFYGNTSNILLIGGYTASPYVNTPNITGNPALDVDYNITETSPCYHSGTNVGLTTDYAGNPWYSTPSMGVYEVVEEGEVVDYVLLNNAYLLKYSVI